MPVIIPYHASVSTTGLPLVAVSFWVEVDLLVEDESKAIVDSLKLKSETEWIGRRNGKGSNGESAI